MGKVIGVLVAIVAVVFLGLIGYVSVTVSERDAAIAERDLARGAAMRACNILERQIDARVDVCDGYR